MRIALLLALLASPVWAETIQEKNDRLRAAITVQREKDEARRKDRIANGYLAHLAKIDALNEDIAAYNRSLPTMIYQPIVLPYQPQSYQPCYHYYGRPRSGNPVEQRYFDYWNNWNYIGGY